MKDESCSDKEDLAVGIFEDFVASAFGHFAYPYPAYLGASWQITPVRYTGGKLVRASTAGKYANHRPSHPLPTEQFL